MTTDRIPIFLISDERYAPCLAVTLLSCVLHTKHPLDFVVLDGGIAAPTQQALRGMLQKQAPLCTLEFYRVDSSLFEAMPDIAHFSRHAYYRYLIPQLKPDIKKALYIDCDILVQADIAELFELPLSGHCLGAAPYRYEKMPLDAATKGHKLWAAKLKKKLGLPENHIYFNSGILLLDCEAMRRQDWVPRLFALTHEKAALLECPDQDILNLVCAESGGYRTLPDEWNVLVDIDIDLGIQYPRPPHLLHFTGGKDMRPWLSFGCPWEAEYWQVAQLSPLSERMQRARLESEMARQRKVLSTLLESDMQLRRTPILRFIMSLCGRRSANRRILAELRHLQKSLFTSAHK